MVTIPTDTPRSDDNNCTNQCGACAFITIFVFLWCVMRVFNDMQIQRFNEALSLTYSQAMLVQFKFLVSYFIGTLVYCIIYTIPVRTGATFSGATEKVSTPVDRITYRVQACLPAPSPGWACRSFHAVPSLGASNSNLFLRALIEKLPDPKIVSNQEKS